MTTVYGEYFPGRVETGVELHLAEATAKKIGKSLQLHRTGRLAEAERVYQDILAENPDCADALYGLAAIAHGAKLHETAIEFVDRAIQINPSNANFHALRGQALRALDRLDEAVASYRCALSLKPGSAKILVSLAVALRRQGAVEEAASVLHETSRLQPRSAEAHINLGNVYVQTGHRDEAADHYRKALIISPESAEAQNNLARIQQQNGDAQAALKGYERAVQLQPAYYDAHLNLGTLRRAQGDLNGAIEAFQRTISLKPDSIDALLGLGECMLDLGLMDRALTCYEHVLAHERDSPVALIGSGVALLVLGQIRKAAERLQTSIATQPLLAEAYVNLGGAYSNEARLEEAAGAFAQALAINPANREAQSNALFLLNYDPIVSAPDLCESHRRWGAYVSHGVGSLHAHPNVRDTERRLSVGYVSGDLRAHSVAFFLEPILANHDRQRIRTFAYSNSYVDDPVTHRLRALCDSWRSIKGLSPDDAARKIYEDGIDILIDLSGHTGGESQLVFARKPAPVQASYLGYPTTTGLPAMDYRITDWTVDPAGAEGINTERPIRLPNSYFCYRPPASAPQPEEAPVCSNGFITFGSFNSLTKINASTLDLWVEVLGGVPDSRLVIKNKSLVDESVRSRLLEQLKNRGVAHERVVLQAWTGSVEMHLQQYRRVDIALDCAPYNGATTTCEALWMGVPVVTLAGTTHAGRMGASILSAAGLRDFVADSRSGFIELCQGLASRRSELKNLRHSMRQRVKASALCDEVRFARDFEGRLREMWREWVASAPTESQ